MIFKLLTIVVLLVVAGYAFWRFTAKPKGPPNPPPNFPPAP
jgi:hypothetical protein